MPYLHTVEAGCIFLGKGTGCPGVFQGNPCPYPSEPVPVHQGTGFDTYGSWVGYNPRVSKPIWDQNAGLHVYVDWPRSGSEHYKQCSNTNLTFCSVFGSTKSLNPNLNG